MLRKEISPKVPSLIGYHTWRERWIKWKEPWRRWRTPWGGQITWKTLSIRLILPSSCLSQVTPYPPNSRCLPWTHIMECKIFCDHIAIFKTTMHLQGVPDEIMCKVFPTTLKGPARVWFGKLPPNTITSFQEISNLFINNFVGHQRHQHSSSNLLNIKQGENESLRTFISRFNKEALLVDEMDDKILLAAFYNGITSDLFIHKLYNQES